MKNQLVSLGLIFACGALMLLSTTLTALNIEVVTGSTDVPVNTASHVVGLLFFKIAAIPLSMLMLFLIYWILPNCKVRRAEILPAAIVVGVLLEVLKYVNLLTWPYLRVKLALEYGPFVYTVTIILWGFVASMVVLGGAYWARRRAEVRQAASVTA